jgi:hypothetical protein
MYGNATVLTVIRGGFHISLNARADGILTQSSQRYEGVSCVELLALKDNQVAALTVAASCP